MFSVNLVGNAFSAYRNTRQTTCKRASRLRMLTGVGVPDWFEDEGKTGLARLRDDFLTRLPTRFGVGPQDEQDLHTAEPQPGEPGYSTTWRQGAVGGSSLGRLRSGAWFAAADTNQQETAHMGAQLPPYLHALPEDKPQSPWVNHVDGKRLY